MNLVRGRDGGAALAVVALSIVLTACGSSPGTAMPSLPPPSQSTPSASAPGPGSSLAAASAPALSPIPTAAATPEGWLPALGLPTIAVPAVSLHTMAGNRALATWGSRTYTVDEPPRSGHASLVVTDLASGTTRRTAIPLLARETTVPPDGLWDPATIVAADDHWLALVVWKRLGPTGGPVAVPVPGTRSSPWPGGCSSHRSTRPPTGPPARSGSSTRARTPTPSRSQGRARGAAARERLGCP